MADKKKELIAMMNKALELEQAARIQYLSHAEQIKGPDAEKIIERLKEIAGDEMKHEGMFREMIASYLGGVPSMSLDVTVKGKNRKQIFEVNLQSEKDAIKYYKEIYKMLCDNKKDFPLTFETLEHQLRHIIIDEQEHVVELSLLLGL